VVYETIIYAIIKIKVNLKAEDVESVIRKYRRSYG